MLVNDYTNLTHINVSYNGKLYSSYKTNSFETFILSWKVKKVKITPLYERDLSRAERLHVGLWTIKRLGASIYDVFL